MNGGMPDSSGFGSYTESGVFIPCTLDGVPFNYTAQMYLPVRHVVTGLHFIADLTLPYGRVAHDYLS